MTSNSSLSSLTACLVRSSSPQRNPLQRSPALALSIDIAPPLHRLLTGADTDTEPMSSIPRSASPSIHQTEQLHPAACSPTSSPLDMLRTPARVVTQSSCPPAPRRQRPLRLYGGFSATDTQGHTSSAESTDCRQLPAASADTAASLRRLTREATAVKSVQDMLCRLRSGAANLAHSHGHDSAESTPVLAIPRPLRLQADIDQDALQAKRMKLFGPARGSTPTNQCVQPRCTEMLSPARLQGHHPTARSEPPTAQTETTVQTAPFTARTDSVRHGTDHTTSLPLAAVVLAVPSTSGLTYRHKVRQTHLAAAILGRQVAPARASSPSPSSAAELAPAIASECTQPRVGPPGSPGLSQEGQSWREANLPTAVTPSPGSSLVPSSHRHFATSGQQQLFISTFDLPQEHPLPATLRPFYAPPRQWGA